jgi:hypothetical protein
VHLSFILDFDILLVDALEHTVLRVLILQTLVSSSLVKDSTHLAPSLVLGMKYSIHTILQLSCIQEDYQGHTSWISRAVPSRVFLQECTIC